MIPKLQGETREYGKNNNSGGPTVGASAVSGSDSGAGNGPGIAVKSGPSGTGWVTYTYNTPFSLPATPAGKVYWIVVDYDTTENNFNAENLSATHFQEGSIYPSNGNNLPNWPTGTVTNGGGLISMYFVGY